MALLAAFLAGRRRHRRPPVPAAGRGRPVTPGSRAHAPVGIFETDEIGRCRYVNERWCELTGLTESPARAPAG